jgi:hypothetical protein
MVKKQKRKNRSLKLFAVPALTVVILIAVSILYYNRLKPDHAHEMSGIVTKVSWGCGNGKSSEGSPIKMPCPTDIGQFIFVNDVKVISDPGFVSEKYLFEHRHDISHVKTGDRVQVKYIVDERGQNTLDCRTCAVIKTE